MRINIGDSIKWVSAAGVLTGTVKSIKLDLNAAGETIPWMTVQDIVGENGRVRSGVCLPGTDGYFAMMKLEVLNG
jgi:hypothetical protein